MDAIDILWPMMGAASFTLGVIHFGIWVRQRNESAHLIFSVAAASVACLSISELFLMRSTSPGEYASVLRWSHVPIATLVLSLVGFVQIQFRPGSIWLALVACALRIASLFANFSSGVNLNFSEITSLQTVELFGQAGFVVPIGTPNPWMLLGQISNVLMIGYMIQVIIRVRRRNNIEVSNKALAVCGSIACFMALGGFWALLVVTGKVSGPLTLTIAFFGVLMVMSYQLGGEVLRSVKLGRSLKQSEAELRESERRMKLAIEAADLGLWTWDLETDEFWFTELGSGLLGFADIDRVNRGQVLSRIHPDDIKDVRVARQEAIDNGRPFTSEFRFIPNAEEVRWIAARGSVEYSNGGKPVRLRGVIYDVTERRSADERFKLVVDGAQAAMIMVDKVGIITLANMQAEIVFGYRREELLGQCVDMLLPGGPHHGNVLKRTDFFSSPRSRPMTAAGEVFGRRKDGTEVPVEIGLTPLRVAGEQCVLASIIDVGERIRSEKEIALQRDEVAHLSRVAMLGEISGSLAHELNQPLTSILSNAQAALRFLSYPEPDLEEVRDSLVQIAESDKRASEVIRHLREMLRKEKVEFKEVDVNGVVLDVVRLLDSDLLNRRSSVQLNLDPDLPTIIGDQVQLQQVLINLIVNACDAMAKTEMKRVLAISTKVGDNASIMVSVQDNGHGIPDDEIEKIFMPFVTSKSDGIGLGLAICGTIIRTHRGKLWAENNPDFGATVNFELPTSSS